MVIRNAPTKLMKELEYGRGYRYNPEYACVCSCFWVVCVDVRC